jgi:hypothetical protein
MLLVGITTLLGMLVERDTKKSEREGQGGSEES